MRLLGRLVCVAGAFACAGLAGCAFTKDYVDVSYSSTGTAEKFPGAEGVEVAVEVRDSRSVKDKVSSKKNGFGMETAPILARSDVAAAVADAIRQELRARGFGVAGRAAVVAADLSRFYCDFQLGMFSGTAKAEVAINLKVKSPSSRIFHAGSGSGESSHSIQLMNGKNAGLALNNAFASAVSNLFSDKEFLEAILQAAHAEKTSPVKAKSAKAAAAHEEPAAEVKDPAPVREEAPSAEPPKPVEPKTPQRTYDDQL